jgi:hypothetical protein
MKQVCSKMKKIVILLTLFFGTKFCNAQTSLLSQLQKFPLVSYLNKPIDSLLVHLPAGFDTAFFISGSGNINIGATLQVNYMPNFKFWIDISITDPQFITIKRNLNTPSEIAWPLHLLRKEKIGSITIFRGAYQVLNEASL